MSERLVTIGSFCYPWLAHLFKTRIESEGIQCFVADENIITLYWIYSPALNGVKLLVKESEAKSAMNVLQQKPISTSIEKKPKKIFARLLITVIFLILIPGLFSSFLTLIFDFFRL